MTRINLNLNGKDDDQKNKDPELPQDSPPQQEEKEKEAKKQEEINMDEILAAVGLDPGFSEDDVTVPPPPTMDWVFIRRVCTAQTILATISFVCLFCTVALSGMTWYKFTACTWTLYLLVTGFTGQRGAKFCSYSHMVAFCIMSAFQMLLHWGSVAWLVYMIYCIDEMSKNNEYGNEPKNNLALFLALGECLSLLGTILTGLFGLIACCKGFGRILDVQDRAIMLQKRQQEQHEQQQSVEEEAQAGDPNQEDEEQGFSYPQPVQPDPTTFN